MVNESTSENIVLQGYISNTNLTNFDFDNTSETIFNSLSALRSTIYSTAIEVRRSDLQIRQKLFVG